MTLVETFSPRTVDVAQSEDERVNNYKNIGVVLSSLSSLILLKVYVNLLIDCVEI
jgi:hypothetical protein